MPALVRTHIAPFPTGTRHLGTAYMALFNLAFVRKIESDLLKFIKDSGINLKQLL